MFMWSIKLSSFFWSSNRAFYVLFSFTFLIIGLMFFWSKMSVSSLILVTLIDHRIFQFEKYGLMWPIRPKGIKMSKSVFNSSLIYLSDILKKFISKSSLPSSWYALKKLRMILTNWHNSPNMRVWNSHVANSGNPKAVQ